MTIQLPIDDLIVPAEVQLSYLEPYKDEPAFLKTIENVYAALKKEQFSKITTPASPGSSVFDLVTGSHGVGKSFLVDKLIKQRHSEYVVCDVDAILPSFPQFKAAMSTLSSVLMEQFMDNYNTDDHRTKLEAVTERFMPAAKYINDRLMTEAIREGLPVIFETSAKTPHIGNFLDKLNETGVLLETHICQAPLTVKQKGFRSRPHNDHDIGITEDQIKQEHDAMTANMKTIAAKSKGNLTIYWRQDATQPLQAAAIGTAVNYTRDDKAFDCFNARFMDEGCCIRTLMGTRKFKPLELQPAMNAPTPVAM